MLTRLRKPQIGKRVFKSCGSALLTALIYHYIFGLEGMYVCFACIGAVYGMGSSFNDGFKNGFNRYVGTLWGGLMVIPFYWLCMHAPKVIPWIPTEVYMTIGLFFTMALNLAFGATSAIQPGAVVYFVVMYTQPQNGYVFYTIARIIDTAFGVIVSLVLMTIFPSEYDKEHGISLGEAFRGWIHQADGHVAKHSIPKENNK